LRFFTRVAVWKLLHLHPCGNKSGRTKEIQPLVGTVIVQASFLGPFAAIHENEIFGVLTRKFGRIDANADNGPEIGKLVFRGTACNLQQRLPFGR
jgi:hypothetical protein